jgi:RHS repeat-associated protein
VRFERDLQAEVDRLFPGQQLVRVTGIRIQPNSGQTVYLKDLKFSNSITVEHNTLGGGAIGHIVRNRRVAADTAVFEDKWFHYDQVGSVLSESDKDGQLAVMHYQDAFGVRQADWETGIPGGVREGWAHNTKELDPGTGLMYMYQRHYVPEYGMFMSRAPYEPNIEHEYEFAYANPTDQVDPRGRYSQCGNCSNLRAGGGGLVSETLLKHELEPRRISRGLKDCMTKQIENVRVSCLPCRGNPANPQTALAYTFLGTTEKPFPNIRICTDHPAWSNMGPHDTARIILHEIAHTCGWRHESAFPSGESVPFPDLFPGRRDPW